MAPPTSSRAPSRSTPFYLLNSRYLIDSALSLKAHLGNRYRPLGIGAVVVLQCLFTYAPPLQALFDNEAIPLRVWPVLFAGVWCFSSS